MSSVKIANLNWMDKSGSWFEQWINVRNGCEIVVIRDRNKDTWMCQHIVTVTNIFLVGWFRGDRDSALQHFADALYPPKLSTSQLLSIPGVMRRIQ